MSDTPKSVVMDIIYKFGAMFSRIGDAAFKDFTEACLGEGVTWDDIRKELDKNGDDPKKSIDAFGKFVQQIIKRLGYDISNCESTQLFDKVEALIVKSFELGNFLEKFAKDFKIEDVLGELVAGANSGAGKEASSGEILSLDDYLKKMGCSSLLEKAGLPSTSGVSFGGPLKDLLDIVLGIVDLIKEISDFEWDKLANDCDEFGQFLKDKYINEEFGRRVLDYVLLLLLKNAKEVFADDINSLIDCSCDKLQEYLSKIIGNKAEDVAKEIRGYLDDIHVIEDKIKELESKQSDSSEKESSASTTPTVSTKSAKSLMRSAKSLSTKSGGGEDKPNDSTDSEEPAKKPSVQLQSALDSCKGKLKDCLKKYLPSYNSLATIFDRTYAILDLFGIIGEKTVDLIELDKVKEANSAIADKTSVDIEDLISGKVGTTIQIPTIRWELLEKMFTAPKDALKEAFPLENVEDVEKLAAKIAAVLRSFDVDFPEFKNIKQFVLDIINRIDDSLKDAIGEIKQKILELKAFLENLLKVMECYAIEFKNALKAEFDGAQTQIKKLGNDLSDEFKKLEVNNAVAQKIFIETFKKAAKDTIKDKYAGKGAEEILHADFDAITKPIETCKKDLDGLVTKIRTDFKNEFNKTAWEKRFNDLVGELKKEFDKQTASVPKNAEELKNFACQSVVQLVKNGSIDNPLSDFDPSAYFKIISDKVSNAISIDFDDYLDQFKEIANKFFNDFLNGLKANATGIPQIGTDIQNLAKDILIAWLENIKHEIFNSIVRPFVQHAIKVIKTWAADFVYAILSNVKSKAKDLIDATSVKQFLGVAESAEKAVETILDVISLVQTVKEGAGNVKSLGDGIQFAIKLYKAIPDNVKDSIAGLIKLPNIDDILGNIRLPEYTLDTENKFFAVTLWKYKYIGDDKQKANVSIQLSIFVGEEGEGENKVEGLYILPVVTGDYNVKFGVGEKHAMEFGVAASLNEDPTKIEKSDEELKKKLSGDGKLGFFVSRGTNGSGVKIKPLAEKDSFSAYLELGFERTDGGSADLIKSDIVDLTIKNYPQKIFAGYANGGFDVGFLSGLEGLELLLKLNKLNGFFDAVLSDSIKIKVEKLAIGYSLQNGLKIEDNLHVKIPFNSNIDLKVVKFKNLTLDLGLEGGDFEASLLTTFVADLKCVAFTFTDLGFGVKCNLFTPEGKAGTLKLKPKINYPTGIGISIDASAVKGGGAIQWDEKKQRFAGALELSILEKFGVDAMLIFTTGKGTDPFSFMGALSVKFNPGIQVGMGFSITAIGGSLGLNRALDVDNLRAAVYDGSLSTVLFVKDIVKNFDKVLANVDKYYPIVEDQMYFGLLAQIAWGTILTADFGLFIQAPSPVTIVVAGIIKVRLADSAEKLLAINANFLGGIQFDKGIFFDASLFDSKIVGISIYGDMALRIYWGGDTKGFILSIGGFHPKYKPESGFNLVDMKRVGMKLDFGPVNMSLEAYFAITSNTVQFGSAFNIKIGWDDFGLTGHASFNVLFQFKPFYFMADMSVGLAVKLGSATLCSISLDFDLSGPAKWHAKGKASICILFFDVSVDFNETWGKGQDEVEQTPIDVFPLFEDEFKLESNWKIISTDLTDNLVTLLPGNGEELVAQPSDLISFSQSKVPLGKEMDCYGENPINDCSQIDFAELKAGSQEITLGEYELEKASFAPTLTHKMSNDEKLNAKSYEEAVSGFKLSADFGVEKKGRCERNLECNSFIDGSNVGDKAKSYIDLWKSTGSSASKPAAQAPAMKMVPMKKAVFMASAAEMTLSEIKSESVNSLAVQATRARKIGSVNTNDFYSIASRTLVVDDYGKTRSKLEPRSSLRRSAVGLKRYVKQIDELLAIKPIEISPEETPSQNNVGGENVTYIPVQYDSLVDKVVLDIPKLSDGDKLNYDCTVRSGSVTVEWITYVRLNDDKYFINKQNVVTAKGGEKYRVHVYLYPKSKYAFKMVNGKAVCDVKLSDGTVLNSDGNMTANGKYCCHFFYDVRIPSAPQPPSDESTTTPPVDPSHTEKDELKDINHIRYMGFHNSGAYVADFIVSYRSPGSSKWTDKKVDYFHSLKGTDKCPNQSDYPNKAYDLIKLNIPKGYEVTAKVNAKGGIGSGDNARSKAIFVYHPNSRRVAKFKCSGGSCTTKIDNPSATEM